MSGELINEAHEILRGLGRADLSDAVAENYGKIVSLRAELTEARRQLKEASEQVPAAYCFASEIAQFNDEQFRIAQMHNRKCSNAEIALYTSAPVPQPAVPEAVALLSELYAQVQGECPALLDESRGGDGALSIRIAAILSATDSEVKK